MDIYVIILLVFLGIFTVMFAVITCAFVAQTNQEPRIKKGTTCETCIYKRCIADDKYKCTFYQEEDIVPFRPACNHYEKREVYEPAYKE